MSHGSVWARRRRYISDRFIQPSLEHELQGELTLVAAHKRYGAKPCIYDSSVWRSEVGAVDEVEQLRPEFEDHTFARRDLQAEVPSPKVGAAQRAPIEAARWRVYVGRCESRFAVLNVVVRHAAQATLTLTGLKPARLSRLDRNRLFVVRNRAIAPSHGSRAALVADHRSRQFILKWASRR